MPVSRWPVDGHASVHEFLAQLVNVFDLIGEVAEVTALIIVFGVPVMSQFDLRRLVARRRQKDQREAALFAVVAFELLEPQLVAIKVQRRVNVGNTHHRMQVFHFLVPVGLTCHLNSQCPLIHTSTAAVNDIRTITLDLDDTLWEIHPVIHRAEKRLYAWLAENYPRITEIYAPDDLREVRSQVIAEFADRTHDLTFLRRTVLGRVGVAAGYNTDFVDQAFEVFDAVRNDVELFPEVIPALEALNERFVVIAVTNGNANLETIGIDHLFSDVITAAMAGAAKPERPVFDMAVLAGCANAAETLHVGDHPVFDVEGARVAGLRTAWVNRDGSDWPSEFEAPDIEVAHIGELPGLLGVA